MRNVARFWIKNAPGWTLRLVPEIVIGKIGSALFTGGESMKSAVATNTLASKIILDTSAEDASDSNSFQKKFGAETQTHSFRRVSPR